MSKSIESLLAEDGVYVSVVVGHSMEPMLRERVDTVAVVPTKERLKKYDVALFRDGEKYVLHRVVKVLPDSYVFCGDNCVTMEKGIADADILGRLDKVWKGKRGEKEMKLEGFGYWLYSRYKVVEFLPRKIFRKIKSALSWRIKKIFGKKK